MAKAKQSVTRKSKDVRIKAVEAYFAGRALREIAKRLNVPLAKLAKGGDLKFK